MEVQCKCHGVSGSCEMRTCWRSLPKFRDLGEHLQERFHQAILVDYVDKRLVPVDTLTEQSPDIGTYGRRCVEDAKGLNSCEYLCCNRGFKRETFVQEERCNCKFQWCCKVICQTCRKTVVVSTCN
ncbi:unnamed protein product [Echinostoma caproni]|uniref:Protein Wnt n=1 Tax=Echinostoma caproni TaxID=27848 RepID=A0A183AYY1_9TREM|nr:unnamed protein product [Echinostoma caproni]